MIDMCTYDYKSLNLKDNLKPEQSFMDSYIEKNWIVNITFINQNIT